MEERNNIHVDENKLYQKQLKKLKESAISQKNKEIIDLWIDNLFSTGSGKRRVTKLLIQIRNFCLKSDKNLDEMTQENMEKIMAYYKQRDDISAATKSDYVRLVKQFYKWFKDKDNRVNNESNGLNTKLIEVMNAKDKEQKLAKIMAEINEKEKLRNEAKKLYNFIEKNLKRAYKNKEIDPSLILNDEDIRIILEKGCNNFKQKAFISLLHETGARAGEFLNIRIRDIVVKENHLEISIDGKTGKRHLYSVSSMPYVLKYLEIHPFKNNTDNFFWIRDPVKKLNCPMNCVSSTQLVNRCFERAGYITYDKSIKQTKKGIYFQYRKKIEAKKKHNLHWFRHSRATIWAPKMTEPMLRKAMGWSKDSSMIKVYAHLCKKDLDAVILDINGIKEQEVEKEEPIICGCGAKNQPHERYCFRCSKPLKVDTLLQDQELVNTEIGKTVRVMMEMMKDPEEMKKFEKFKEKT